MASNHTADPSAFNDPISMLDGSDVKSATQMRTIFEKLADNCAFLLDRTDALLRAQVLTVRLKSASAFADSGPTMAAVGLDSAEGARGPTLAIKAGASIAVHDSDEIEPFSGAIPSLTTVRDAAIDDSGRIVVVGATTPFNAYRIPGGSWTAGATGIGANATSIVFAPAASKFFAAQSDSNIYASPDAVAAWTSVPTGLGANVQGLAVVGAGGGAGRIVALGQNVTPTFSLSTNNGASFALQATTVPNGATAASSGSIAGCPKITRLGLNGYVYHVARFNTPSRLCLSRSADGVNWSSGPTITAATGRTFVGNPVLNICKTTGLMVIVCNTSRSSDSYNYLSLFASTNFARFVGTSSNTGSTARYAVAGGRLLRTDSGGLSVSDGISHEVYT